MKFFSFMKWVFFTILPLSIIFGVIMNFYHIPLAYQLTVNIMMGIIVGWIIIEIKKKKEIAKVNEERKQMIFERIEALEKDVTSIIERMRADTDDCEWPRDRYREVMTEYWEAENKIWKLLLTEHENGEVITTELKYKNRRNRNSAFQLCKHEVTKDNIIFKDDFGLEKAVLRGKFIGLEKK